MVNVPTVVWIDEDGRIARPNDVAFTTEQGGKYAGVSTADQMALLRRWVAGEAPPAAPAMPASGAGGPTAEAGLARAHFGLGWWLFEQGRGDAANRHFSVAGELAPEDFTIRRGTMRFRGADPFGPEFMQMVAEWHAGGNRYYLPLPVE